MTRTGTRPGPDQLCLFVYGQAFDFLLAFTVTSTQVQIYIARHYLLTIKIIGDQIIDVSKENLICLRGSDPT